MNTKFNVSRSDTKGRIITDEMLTSYEIKNDVVSGIINRVNNKIHPSVRVN